MGRGLETYAATRPSSPKGAESHSEGQAEILAGFSSAEQKEIVKKQKLLSTLGLFIGKDFDMPVLLNEPGAGWHWNFKDNHIKIDPKDLLEKPLDYLRFVISHEGGHRRISRTDFIPKETWQQPGFSFMMNAIEDPRDNNFVADAYPKFKDQMALAYSMETEFEAEAKKASKDKLGGVPRFVQAGHEYIKIWFQERKWMEEEERAKQEKRTIPPFSPVVDASLPKDVQEVVSATLAAARKSWWWYPSKEEADSSKGEEIIRNDAEASYKINLEKVWPEFKKLVEEDMKDEQMRQAMEDMQKDGQEGQAGEGGESEGSKSGSIPQELKDKLTEGEQKELQEAIQSAQEGRGTSGPISQGQLSPELKKKLEEYMDSLPEEKKRELAERARKMLEELEEEINKALEGKLAEHGEHAPGTPTKQGTEGDTPMPDMRSIDIEGAEDVRGKLSELLDKDRSEYNRARQELLPIIDRLEDDLREIFTERRAEAWEGGHRTGKRINLSKRIAEKAKGISAVQSKAWERRNEPQEKDYAFELLVDLSGSMTSRGKIRETFKAIVVLSEVLNRLSIRTEVLGFNDRMHEYQGFSTEFSNDIRETMGGMLSEVNSERARYNDDGWAVKQASARLAQQEATEKFLIVLSDGVPEESPAHKGSEFRLENVVKQVMSETDQKLIGLGIGPGTGHVEAYYPNSLANIPVADMAERLAELIKEAVANYREF